MIADMLSNKKLNPIVVELFIKGRKLNISLVFITQSYFPVPKSVRENFMHCSIMKIPNKQEVQQIASHHLSDTNFKDLINLHTKIYIYFSGIDATFVSDDPSCFTKNLVERI